VLLGDRRAGQAVDLDLALRVPALAADENASRSASSLSPRTAKDAALDAGAVKVKLSELGLSARVTKALEDAGIKSAAGLARKTASALKEIDGIGEKGKVNGFNFHLASFFIKSLKKDTPVFRDFIWVPVVNLVQKFIRERIVLLVDQAVNAGQLRQVPNRS